MPLYNDAAATIQTGGGDRQTLLDAVNDDLGERNVEDTTK